MFTSLTDNQKRFVKNIVLHEMDPVEAYISAGYPVIHDKVACWSAVGTLLSSKPINDAIDKLRKRYFDLDEVRRDIILEHEQTRDMDITSIMEPVSYYDENGNMQTRVDIKPVSQWSPELRKACTGFDRFGIPKFRDKDSASKELSRLYGLYKDNTVVVQQDLDAIIGDAMGIDVDNTSSDDEVLAPDKEVKYREELESLDDKLFGRKEEEIELPKDSELGEVQEDGDIIMTDKEYNGMETVENKDIQAKLSYMLNVK